MATETATATTKDIRHALDLPNAARLSVPPSLDRRRPSPSLRPAAAASMLLSTLRRPAGPENG